LERAFVNEYRQPVRHRSAGAAVRAHDTQIYRNQYLSNL